MSGRSEGSDRGGARDGPRAATSTHEHDQTLSEQRAASVKAYLAKAGIAVDRLETADFAKTNPVAPVVDAMGRAQNRRVELVKR